MQRTEQAPAMRSRAARTMLAGALAFGIALPGAAAAPPAYAENASVTITQRANPDATYDIYRIFNADIDAENKAKNVAWASSGAQAAVLAFINANGYPAWLAANGHTGTGADAVAQNAAEFISSKVDQSPGANSPKWVEGASFADKLAEAVSGAVAKEATVASGAAYTAAEGYVLVVTTPASLAAGDMGTAAIWFPLGGSAATIQEKAAVPVLDKQVKEDSTGTWGKTADAEFGQAIDYRLELTMPDSLDTLEAFYGKFTDTLPAGMAADRSSVRVSLAGADVTRSATVDVTGQVLTVECADWKALSGAAPGARIEVAYKAYITGIDTIVYGNDGNINSTYFDYSNNPLADGAGTPTTSRTNEPEAKAFVYQMRFTKTDKATGEPLAGVEFAVRNQEGKYQAVDNTWTAEKAAAKTYTTASDGTILVKGVDEGTYTLEEKAPAAGYAAIDVPVSVRIEHGTLPATTSADDDVTLTATVSGGLSGTVLEAVDPNAGRVDVKVVNDKMVELALTGAEGVGLAGAGVVAVGLGWYLLRRRREAGAVQEGPEA